MTETLLPPVKETHRPAAWSSEEPGSCGCGGLHLEHRQREPGSVAGREALPGRGLGRGEGVGGSGWRSPVGAGLTPFGRLTPRPLYPSDSAATALNSAVSRRAPRNV